MTFYPLEFFGIPGCQLPEQPWGLGWQGIVPSKVRKMSTIAVRTLITEVISLEEIIERVDPGKLWEQIDEALCSMMSEVVEEVGMEKAPQVWAHVPPSTKVELIESIRDEGPAMMADVMKKVKDQVSEVFDIEEMVVKKMLKDKPLLNHMFLSCGYKELEFIRDTGAYMGFFLVLSSASSRIGWP
jgi:hypothetical protein